MIRLFQALLSRIFFTFILDFLFLMGIQLHYLDFYGIDEYYNVLFAEHQNFWVLLAPIVIIGYVTTYLKNLRYALIVMALLCALPLATLFPQIGKQVGTALLQKQNVRYSNGKYIYKGTLYYEGRDRIVMFDDELQRLITLEKKELKP